MLPLAVDPIVTTALTGVIGFAGVAVGGWVTYKVQRSADDRADERERERREHEARRDRERRRREQQRERVAEAERLIGITRVHRDQLRRAIALLHTVYQGAVWEQPDEVAALFSPLPDEELRLVAFHLTADGWETLTKAHMARDTFLNALAANEGKPPPPEDRQDLDGMMAALRAADETLESLERSAIHERDEAVSENPGD